ncbi:hypothetical protein ACTFQF_00295 [Aliivibrio fischeri]|uniref:Uncharacterized protein n=1 Tax=Aliivibrio fischeri (strain MJ11) TaxID=388396 RepID=B5EW04_ALIFM|nr:hypothetical protein [Aliivibrio fischeri]ACH64698.1 hypothetical protein VFMJ11_B0061 [Aliivibrio fischeri MJ11]MUK37496.1 hypothetical protein [Aliivibrio fischeri]
MDSQVIAAIISGLLSVLATLIPSVTAFVLAKRFLGEKRYVKTALQAMYEVRLLRHVIGEYEISSNLSERQIRKTVFEKHGLSTKNRFTPQRLEQKIESYEKKAEENLIPLDHL